jgi:hypothetical protein
MIDAMTLDDSAPDDRMGVAASQLPVPPPARAVELMGAAQGHWTAHDASVMDWPVFGRVIAWHTWMVLQPFIPGEQPELGISWTFLVMPRSPIRCVHAMAYRSAQTMANLLHLDDDQVFSDTVDLSPELAWQLASHPDPHTWYQSLVSD